MGDKSKIEWTDATWNPIRARNRETGKAGHFCIHVSDGCKHCYAERMQPRFGNPVRYAAQDFAKVELFLDEKALTQPLRWRRPRRVFVCSMTDLFLEGVPDEWIKQIWEVMERAHQHTFQVLTKRSFRMKGWIETCWATDKPVPNVWCGVSVEHDGFVIRLRDLAETQAAVRFASLEPLLGPLDLAGDTWIDGDWRRLVDYLDWVIVGGESGPGARPMHPDWARELRDQCVAAGTAFHFKQFGEWAWIEDRTYSEAEHDASTLWPGAKVEHHSCGRTAVKIGKKRAGRMLDGRTWDEFPA